MQDINNQLSAGGASYRPRFDENINGNVDIYVSFPLPCPSLQLRDFE